MKILIHGATNWGSSNFGDFIYIEAVIRYLRSHFKGCIIKIAQPSDYFLKYITKDSYGDFHDSEADVFIYAPGGYFGEGHEYTKKDILIHFVRFFTVGLKAALTGKRIYILGIGAGPINNWLFRISIKIICKHSISISVRDKESFEALYKIGINNARIYFDPIIAIPLLKWAHNSEQLNKVIPSGKVKNILIHYNHSLLAMEYFAEAIKEFIKNREEVNVIISSDQILPSENVLYDKFCKISGIKPFRYKYDNPYEFISLLQKCDTILTCKLHVGVVGMMLKKSVICAAEHPEKTKRFYEHMGCSERFVSLYKTNSAEITYLLHKFFNVKVDEISKADLENAQNVWHDLDSIGVLSD